MYIKIRRTDKLFSEYLRKKIGKCELCGRKEGTLQVSHFFGRRHESTRFDENNCDIFCFSCHQKFHESPYMYSEWKQGKLGEKKFKDLQLQANCYQKKDDALAMLWLKEKLKELL